MEGFDRLGLTFGKLAFCDDAGARDLMLSSMVHRGLFVEDSGEV